MEASQRLLEALKEISDPIAYMRARLKPGEVLNGQMANSLSNDPNFLKSIAREALAQYEQEQSHE